MHQLLDQVKGEGWAWWGLGCPGLHHRKPALHELCRHLLGTPGIWLSHLPLWPVRLTDWMRQQRPVPFVRSGPEICSRIGCEGPGLCCWRRVGPTGSTACERGSRSSACGVQKRNSCLKVPTRSKCRTMQSLQTRRGCSGRGFASGPGHRETYPSTIPQLLAQF